MASSESVEMVNTDKLIIHPDNPRTGNITSIIQSIERNGWYGTIVAQRSTNFVLAGNHRLIAAQSLGTKEVPVYWVDVDDATARRILLADNRTSDLASYDNDLLLEALSRASDDDGLLGTGWTDEDIERLTGGEPAIIDDFKPITPDSLDTEYRCPSCGYEWSGQARPGDPTHESDYDD